jgi:hypothetical protein
MLGACAVLVAACSGGGGGTAQGLAPGHVVELGGSAGMIPLSLEAQRGGARVRASITSVPALAWEGRTSAIIPMLSFEGVDVWTLTFISTSGVPRVVNVLPPRTTATPGDTTLSFLEELERLDENLIRPADEARAALYDRMLANLRSSVGTVRELVLRARHDPVMLGTTEGEAILLDVGQLRLIDALVEGARAARVATFSKSGTAAQAVGPLVVAVIGVVAVGAAIAAASGLGAGYLTLAAGTQAAAVVESSDTPRPWDFSEIRDFLVENLREALPSLEDPFAQSYRESWRDAHARVLCVNGNRCNSGQECLECSSIYHACFPNGSVCCGQGLWATECSAGERCLDCGRDDLGLTHFRCAGESATCENTGGGLDGGLMADGGPGFDAGVAADGGGPSDAGVRDGGPRDGGADAGVDGGRADAGVDGGADGGTRFDGGTDGGVVQPDGGAGDGGTGMCCCRFLAEHYCANCVGCPQGLCIGGQCYSPCWECVSASSAMSGWACGTSCNAPPADRCDVACP